MSPDQHLLHRPLQPSLHIQFKTQDRDGETWAINDDIIIFIADSHKHHDFVDRLIAANRQVDT